MRLHLAYPHTLDGHCSAAIASLWGNAHGHRLFCYPLGDTVEGKHATLFERIVDRVAPRTDQQTLINLENHNRDNEAIMVLAYDLSAKDATQLVGWGHLTYCNHAAPYLDYDNILSCVKVTTGQATCEALWERLYPYDPMPLAVQLVGRYTISNMDGDKHPSFETYYQEILPFTYGLRSVKTDPGRVDGWEECEKLFASMANAHVKKRIKEGCAIIRYLREVAQPDGSATA